MSRRERDTRTNRYSPIPRRPSPTGRTTYPELGGSGPPGRTWRQHPNFHDIVHTAGCTVCKEYLNHRLDGSSEASASSAEAERSAYYSRDASAREGALARQLDELWLDHRREQDRADHFERELNRAIDEIRQLENKRGLKPRVPKGEVDDSRNSRSGAESSLRVVNHAANAQQVLGSPVSLIDRFTDPAQEISTVPLSERLGGSRAGESSITGEQLLSRLDETVAAELAGDLMTYQGRHLYNGVNAYQMSEDWAARAERNARMGLPPPLGTIPFSLGRGPIATDPQDEDEVRNFMNDVKQSRDRKDKAAGAEFISRIEDLGVKDQDLAPHLQLAKELWAEMPKSVQNYRTSTMKKLVTKPKTAKIAAPNLGSTLIHWRDFISMNPQNRPTGVRATARGVAHIFDLTVHLLIARISAEVYIPNDSTKQDRRSLKRTQGIRSAAFFRAVIYLIASRSYAQHLHDLQIQVHSTRRESRFDGYEDENEEIALDDAVIHLAHCGISIDWMENPTTIDFALSYIRDWERRNDGKYTTARLHGLFDRLYPEGRPVVPLVTNLGLDEDILDTEVAADVDESLFGDLNNPLPSDTPAWYTNPGIDVSGLPRLPEDPDKDRIPTDAAIEYLPMDTSTVPEGPPSYQPGDEELDYGGEPAIDTDDRMDTPTQGQSDREDAVSLY